MNIDFIENADFLSMCYAQDVMDCTLLCEYPSSNSDQTPLRNSEDFIIHDPFPPPNPSLLKTLGPHHLMFGWGNAVPVASQIAPPDDLVRHWEAILGLGAKPDWREFKIDDRDSNYLVLFPHESVEAKQQAIDPYVNYQLHSKKVIECIDCPQPNVLKEIEFPCIAKLSHGYAGLGNYMIRSPEDDYAMRTELNSRWKGAELVITKIVDSIVGDYGVQYYLTKGGHVKWIGYTEQNFDANQRWCGGRYDAQQQYSMAQVFKPFIEASSRYLHENSYFGVVGIDVLKDQHENFFLVDLNPRLTGITPFVMGAKKLEREHGFTKGLYSASCTFSGEPTELFDFVEQIEESRVAVLSYYEDRDECVTLCHLGFYSNSDEANVKALRRIKLKR